MQEAPRHRTGISDFLCIVPRSPANYIISDYQANPIEFDNDQGISLARAYKFEFRCKGGY